MLAYTYISHGKFELIDKPKPKLQSPRDAIVRITLGSICTSDLHIKHGSVAMPATATPSENAATKTYSPDEALTWTKVGSYYIYDENYRQFYAQGPVWVAFIGGQMYASINAGQYNYHIVRRTVPADRGYFKFSHVFDDGTKAYFNISD